MFERFVAGALKRIHARIRQHRNMELVILDHFETSARLL